MNFEQARADVQRWITDFVEKPTPLLNGWPPCPYARQARLQNRIDIREGVHSPGALATVTMESWDVIIYVYDPQCCDAQSFDQQKFQEFSQIF